MRLLIALFPLFLLAACAKPEPLPVIYDLVDGSVTTELQEVVPLGQFADQATTRLLLLPIAEPAEDTARRIVSADSRARVVAAGNYSMGFAPQVVLAPNTPVGTFSGNPAASLNRIAVTSYPPTDDADAVTARIKANHANQNIVLVGSIELLTEVANSFEHVDLDWPVEQENALVYVAAGATAATVQPFAIQLDRD